MLAIKVHKGIMVPLLNNNIDTDQLIPKSYLKRIEKTGFGEFLFDEWRYLPNRSNNPNFILNETRYQKASVLLTGDNFGCGSSREHAAWALLDYGFKVIIAGGYSDIFYMNAIKNGILPIILDQAKRDQLAGIPDVAEVIIDLPHQLVKSTAGDFKFEIEPTWKHKLLNGLDDIAITLNYEQSVKNYEEKMPEYWQ